MTNPYTEPSISGYNSSAPSDDGANTSANEITWSKHKDKLGDPLKNYSDAINSAITAAFGKNFLNAVSTHSANYTILASDRGKLLDASNTITLTLLAATSAGSGFALVIRNAGSGVVTIDGDGSETINGSTTLTLQVGGWAILECDGTNWSTLTNVSPDPPVVSGYISGNMVYVENDTGAVSGGLDVDFYITASTWESIGPTDSGADYIWTDMDSIPTTATAVILHVYSLVRGSTNNDTYSVYTSMRKTGSSTPAGFAAGKTANSIVNRSGSSERCENRHSGILIPLESSRRFDLYWSSAGTSPTTAIYAYIMGWIE